MLINQLSFNKEKFLSSNVERGGFAPSSNDIKYNAELKLTKKNFENLITKLQNLKKETNKPFIHFDWKLDFPEVLNPYLTNGDAGFDIVIANPPYVSWYSKQARVLDNDLEKALRSNYTRRKFKVKNQLCDVFYGEGI